MQPAETPVLVPVSLRTWAAVTIAAGIAPRLTRGAGSDPYLAHAARLAVELADAVIERLASQAPAAADEVARKVVACGGDDLCSGQE